MAERYRLLESGISAEESRVLRRASAEGFDGAILTNVFPDFNPARQPSTQSLRLLKASEISSETRSGYCKMSGGSFLKKEELAGKFKLHIYG